MAELDRRCWSASVGLGITFVVAAGLAFWFGSDVWDGSLHASRYADLSPLTRAGQLIWGGDLTGIYKSVTTDALPLSFVVMAPLAPLLDVLHEPVYFHNLSTLIAGSYILLLGIVLLHAVRRLAWDLNVRSRLWLVQVVAVVLVMVPEYEYGHVEDVLALACVLYGIRRFLRGENLYAALLLGVASGFKQWAILLLPLIIFSAPPATRLRVAVVGLSLPALLLTLAWGLDGSSAFHTLKTAVASNADAGHPGLLFIWSQTSSEVTRVLAVVLAIGLAWKFRSPREPPRLLLLISAVLVLWPLTDAVNYSYYWSPALLCFALAAVSADPRVRFITLVMPIAALLWTVPRSLGSSPGGWWLCELTLLAAAVAVQARRPSLKTGHQVAVPAREPGS